MLTFARKVDLANLDTDKLKNVPTNLGNLKSKVGKWDIDKLVPVSVDLSKLSDAVKDDIVKKKMHIMLKSKILEKKYLILLT